MTDTPEHIKKLQLQIWLSKTPAERLRQFLIDNDTLFQFWKNAKSNIIKPVVDKASPSGKEPES